MTIPEEQNRGYTLHVAVHVAQALVMSAPTACGNKQVLHARIQLTPQRFTPTPRVTYINQALVPCIPVSLGVTYT